MSAVAPQSENTPPLPTMEARARAAALSAKASTLNQLVGKLHHPMLDVRRRALAALHSKLKTGLAEPLELALLAEFDGLCAALVGWAEGGEDATAHNREQALYVMRALAEADAGAARQLIAHGALTARC